MKTNRILSLIAILLSFTFIQCTSDLNEGPRGETGLAGIDGTNGLDGTAGADGADTVASCVACHNDSHTAPIEAAYMAAGHFSGGSWARGTSTSCAQCHNNEGYIDYLSGKYVDGDGNPSVNPDGYAVSNPITCTGCHDSHRSFDFENDGNDYAIRSNAPVFLVLDPTVSIDFTNDADPLGLSNACATCHQPRPSYPIPVGTGDYTITSQRFGPHHGPQSTMLEGIMGAVVGDPGTYPEIGSATHRTGSSCTACHMSESTDGTGGHTWAPVGESCLACHSSVPTEVTGYAADMATLLGLLKAKNYIADNDEYVLGADGINNASSSNPLVVPVKEAQAIWNYKTLLEDQSHGIHNPVYAKALLANSIEALQ